MKKVLILVSFLVAAGPALAVDKDQYCEKLHAERDTFRGLNFKMDDKKLIGLYEKIIPEGNLSAEEMKAMAISLKMSVNPKELAAYKRDYYDKNCAEQIQAQLVDDSLPPEAKDCAAIAAQDPDAYLTRSLSQNSTELQQNLKEFQAINTAAIIDIQNEAIEKKMKFPEYAKLVAQKTKAKGAEMILGRFAEYTYLFAFHRRHCTSEAGLTGRLNSQTISPNTETTAALKAVVPQEAAIKPRADEASVKTGK